MKGKEGRCTHYQTEVDMAIRPNTQEKASHSIRQIFIELQLHTRMYIYNGDSGQLLLQLCAATRQRFGQQMQTAGM